LLLLLQAINLTTVFNLYKWSLGPTDLSRGPVLVSNPEARKLSFSRGNLGNGMADVFANQLANICNAVIVKLGQGLSIFDHLYIGQIGRSIASETKLLGKPSEEVLPGI
jgi:hypothetical protein